ncbi:MAG TPA: hypothetical protein PKA63_07630 [Oligoflexia bacterium]|nr:hypothetical protein [Oligoflexia bacterium]HMP48520.1 hypothetical protein [Oligoflexia bacterium]
MIPLLLRPYLLGAKNEFIREYRTRFWNRTTFAALFVLFILSGMYIISISFFTKFREHEVFSTDLIHQFLSLSLLAILSVTCFSAIISAMGALFSSKDLTLLFLAPISLNRIFFSKLLHILFLSSWMFALVSFVFALGLRESFDISWLLLPSWFFHFLLFLIIPTNIGIITVIAIANIVPPDRLREVVILFVALGLFALLSFDQETTLGTGMDNSDSIAKAVLLSKKFSRNDTSLYPSHLLSSVITSSITNKTTPVRDSILLSGYALFTTLISLTFFRVFFLNGWAKSSNSNVQRITYKSQWSTRFGNFLFKNPSPLRAFMGKELRTFVRDTTQSIQLLLLLTLTFIYIYNFRVIQSSVVVERDYAGIWSTILNISNILFGGFVVAAVCTRFVFPTISLEGASYQILRSTPISLQEFIRYKFLTWFVPILVLALILFVSGSIAIDFEAGAILTSAFYAINISASLIAVGISTGAIYSRFDWENPIQVSSSFGSLVYMMISLGVVFINILPASLLFGLLNSSMLNERLISIDLTFIYLCCVFITIFINGAIIRRALLTAENHLENAE